jgi:hypothetical protein
MSLMERIIRQLQGIGKLQQFKPAHRRRRAALQARFLLVESNAGR